MSFLAANGTWIAMLTIGTWLCWCERRDRRRRAQ